MRQNCRNLVLSGTILIWIIKLVVRPSLQVTGSYKFLLGISPNLLGAFLIPFGAYWLYTHPRFLNAQLRRFSFFSDMRLTCLFGFVLVVINEYLQLIPFFGRTFDYYDILFTAIGLLISYYSFSLVQKKYNYEL